ncbi:MAG TPA: L,D-transpeptidase [Verrucomicrobiae bacterium]|jgi:lipoprotein-anchoring transpeptidase ErfK/SrfK
MSRQKNHGGGFRWLIFLILIAGAVYFFWLHERLPKKIVRAPATAKIVSAKPQPKPIVVTRQSPVDFPRPVLDVLEAQVALARRGISPGSIDGAIGSQTRAAISVFQEIENLPVTGRLDTNTRPQLTLDAPILTNYAVTTNDLARLQPLGKTWLEKSQQSALDYETELELVAEKAHSHPLLIQKLNPGVNWTNISAGTILKIPDVDYPEPVGKAAFVAIHLSEKFLEAFDGQTNLLAHFPCSIAARFDKRPVGELHVVVVAPNPNYTFDPELFPESSETQKMVLPPGPNNPVGVAWIGLDKTGYGIHGTPAPEQVGRTESHGCFRLANWDAAYLLKLAWTGMPVEVEP